MDYIGDYRILENLHKTRSTVVYRGQKDGDPNTVVIKYLRAKFPSSYEISRFKQEYDLIKNLDVEGVIQTHELISYDSGIALVLEDFDAVSLKELIKNKEIDLGLFFTLAIKLAEILGNLHRKNVIHRDIKPENILVSRDHKQVKLTDFGISQIVTHENEEIYNPDVIEGTLKYMSPEQTGRMNRAIDYRTDLYSLGITFYEMLTGTTPFNSNQDPLEIIHAHIARTITPPEEIAPQIPPLISKTIHKLLIKPAEERYQNAFGLLYDLKKAYKQWKEKGVIEDFELATHDFSLKFNIPQQMVGRENETRSLLESFERMVKNGVPEIMLISGYPGVGKSFLVDELYKPIVARKGYFVSGKYEQFKKDVPYSAIIQAFIKLIQRIMVESNERIEAWRQEIQNALGDNAKVITDIIPQLKMIIGEPPKVPELSPEESENRFHYVCRNFLQVFTTSEHPLVLVLDDLQWADLASLNLIYHFATNLDNGHLMFIGMYRDNEISEEHPLINVLEELEKSHMQVKTIHITPLDRDSVRRLLGKFLRMQSEDIASLADIIFDKTNGNPFFVNQFLKRLYEKNILEIDSHGHWHWDTQAIRNMEITDNVIDLMVQKIRDISRESQEVLKVGSCIGNRFDLETLCVIRNRTPDQILAEMRDAMDTGLVYFNQVMCYFLHDRIQEAAYSLLSEEEKVKLHYFIGSYTYRTTSGEELLDKIFYIVNHLNIGVPQIESREEMVQVASLNLLAGKKAKDSGGYQSALSYLLAGIDLLADSDWEENYDLMHGLYINAAEAYYLNARFSDMEDYLQAVIAKSKTYLDRIRAYELRIQAYTAQNRLIDVVQNTKDILSSLGINLPENIDNKKTGIELLKTKFSLRKKTIEDIKEHPRMEDPHSLAVLRIATSAAPAFYVGGYTMDITYIVLKMVRLSMRKGVSPQTPFWLACYAMVLHPLDQLEDAFSYSDMALALREQLSVQKIRSKFIIYSKINYWRHHLRDSITTLQNIYHTGFEVGDLSTSLFAATYYCKFLFYSGKELNYVEQEIAKVKNVTQKNKMETMHNYQSLLHQVVQNLLGNTASPTQLTVDAKDKADLLQSFQKKNDGLGIFCVHLYSCHLNYLFGDLEQAYQEMQEVKKYLIAVTGGLYFFALYYFLRALIILDSATESPPEKRKKAVKRVEYHNGKLEKWAQYAPMNFLHKHLLVSAEMARIKGDFLEAEDLYERAAQGALANGYNQEQALALELAAHFYLQRGFEHIAGLYFSRAANSYARWGATAKVEDLKSKHPELLSNLGQESLEIDNSGTHTDTTTSGSAMVDLHTVLKASQAISGEIALERVLEQLMKIGIENAGAQRGVLFFEEEGRLLVKAESDTLGNIEVFNSVSIDDFSGIPGSVVNYVFKTNEHLVLDNACEDERFAKDPYIEKNGTQSILCLPIKQKSEASVILYLENNLTSNTFTPERFEVLRVISSQAAISIENARLFEVARRDGLTELINHRYFKYSLEREIEDAKRHNRKVSLLMLDIDHFKDLNDTHGHQAGDQVLREVADILSSSSPNKDLVGRYGGEEFTFILPRFSEDEAKSLAERIRSKVEEHSIDYCGQELKVTISVGMATFPFDASNSDELIQASDRAMYMSKQAGRNRVTMY
ncbi:MAG: diguanylate cyclase [Thermodesulfobacteriota bacterium]